MIEKRTELETHVRLLQLANEWETVSWKVLTRPIPET